jgi:hypothetical protein
MSFSGLSRTDALKYLGLILVAVVAAWPFSTAGLASADMGPLLKLKGGVIAPKAPHKTIRLESQEVTIRLGRSTYLVNAVFHFMNDGVTTTEWIGFPKQMSYDGISADKLRFLRFEAWVDEVKTAVAEERDLSAPENRSARVSRENRWKALHVTFAGHKETTIHCVYEAAYEYRYDSKSMSYLYGTGAYWKGCIGSAGFTIDSTDVGGTENISIRFGSPPSSRRMGENVVRYEIYDFNPSPEDQVDVVLKVRSREGVPMRLE